MNEFEFESLGQVQPQFNPMRADLGINQYAAEFERQNRGMERVQRQVEANQKMLLKNAETESKNIGMEIEDAKKIANFSKCHTYFIRVIESIDSMLCNVCLSNGGCHWQ